MSCRSTDLVIICACIICIVFDGSEVQFWNHKLESVAHVLLIG